MIRTMQPRRSNPGHQRGGGSALLPGLRESARFGTYDLLHADALDWLADARPRSIHAVVTYPPHGLIEYHPRQIAKQRSGRGGV
ncbi:MAG: hypothetical protein IT449_08555 [Phycisphaerales bacterium]|nr:hypothetical protein [Phycisphaerales bacterium]